METEDRLSKLLEVIIKETNIEISEEQLMNVLKEKYLKLFFAFNSSGDKV